MNEETGPEGALPQETEPVITNTPRTLAPSARSVQFIVQLLSATFLSIILVPMDYFWSWHPSWWPLPAGGLALILVPVLYLKAIIYPFFWYRCWRYQLRENDILLSFGVLWKVHRSIPRQRIQHADISSGPVDRMFGINDLTLYTAGSGEGDAVVPGLLENDATMLRDVLLSSGKSDP